MENVFRVFLKSEVNTVMLKDWPFKPYSNPPYEEGQTNTQRFILLDIDLQIKKIKIN